MAKQDPQPGSGPRSRQRGKPVQVQAKKPVGFIAGATVLALLLLGVVGYAATHQGAGFQDPLKRADQQVKGVVIADKASLKRGHVEGPVRYPQTPPNGGDHNPVPQVCRVYDRPIPNENAVHSLEHGAVWITYQQQLPAAQVAQLRALDAGDPYLLMSPVPGQGSPVDLSAWGRRLSVKSASDERVEQFIQTYKNGPQTPEKGSTCAVGNSTTGSVAAAAPAPQSSVAVPVK